MISLDSESIRNWFLKHKRYLPWRLSPSPYQVWISEVMLQQTQAQRVVDYYIRWMKAFPSVEALANASLEAVIKVWEGLGYYSRARALHEAARFLVAHFQGKLPDTFEELSKVKGLGPYTSNAILAFAFHKKAAPVDANVVRVLARFFLLDGKVGTTSFQKKIQSIADQLLPENSPWEVSEALIELGALHCKPKPSCQGCPLQSTCLAFLHKKEGELPYKGQKVQYEVLYRDVAVIIAGEEALVRQVEKGVVFAGLWEFPYFQSIPQGKKGAEIQQAISSSWNIVPSYICNLSEKRHTFTRFRACLYPKVFELSSKPYIGGYLWKQVEELQALPFSSGHRRVLQELYEVWPL